MMRKTLKEITPPKNSDTISCALGIEDLQLLPFFKDEDLLKMLLDGENENIKDALQAIDLANIQNITDNPKKLARELVQLIPDKSSQIFKLFVAFDLILRRVAPQGTKIKEPADLMPYISYLRDQKQEHFICTSLNGAHEIIKVRIITIGLVNMTQVHPREVFADAISDRASAVILAHNHPSGDLIPSTEDKTVTKRLVEAGKLLGIRVLDHIIFSRRGMLSLATEGILEAN